MVQLTGTVDGQRVLLTLDESKGWCELTDADTGTSMLSSRLRPSDAAERDGDNVVTWRGRRIVLDGDHAALEGFLVAFDRAKNPKPAAESRPAQPSTSPYPVPLPAASTVSARRSAYERSLNLSGVVYVIGWVVGVLGVVGGAVIALIPVEECARFDCETTRPFIGIGVGTAAAAVVQASLLLLVSSYVKLQTLAVGPSDRA